MNQTQMGAGSAPHAQAGVAGAIAHQQMGGMTGPDHKCNSATSDEGHGNSGTDEVFVEHRT